MSKKTQIVFVDEPFLLPQFIKEATDLSGADCTVYTDTPVDDEQKVARARDAEIIVVDIISTYDKAVLEKLSKLKTIVTTSVAVDHIDTAYCKERGIEVINFPGFNARAVAEASFTYLLSLVRHAPQAWQNVLGGGWNTFVFQGNELSGKTIGVVGAGNVGTEVIKIAHGFGMRVLAHTKNPSAERAQSLGIDSFSDMPTLLKESDFVMLVVPANADTKDFISKKELSLMKKSAYLINVGRWQVVDTLALAEAIYERTIAGAGLDFIGPEPYNVLAADLRIQEMVNSPNVLLFPHIAFNTHEANLRLGERVIRTLKERIKNA